MSDVWTLSQVAFVANMLKGNKTDNFPVNDFVIAERREQIRKQRLNSKENIAPLQAECSVMGHVRFGPKSDCFYCGAHYE